MPGRKDAGSYFLLDGGRQLQQTQCVRDLRARFGNRFRQLLLGQAKIFHHLLICCRFLKRIQCNPMEVLQQGIAQHIIIRNSFYYSWDRLKPR